jgi:hypothetical protein
MAGSRDPGSAGAPAAAEPVKPPSVMPADIAPDDDPPAPDVDDPVHAWPIPSGPIAEQLFGHWRGHGQVGDCINYQSWYSFAADGRLVNRSIDDNACLGPRLAAEASGYYSLDGNLLGIVLVDGLGSDRPFEMASTTAVVGERQQRMTIAIAERSADQFRPAATVLDDHAFTSADGATFRSERYVLLLADVGGEPLFEQDALVTLHVDPPLPVAEGTPCRVELTFRLAQFDAAVAPDAAVDEITLAFDATVRADQGWKQLIASDLAAVAREDQVTAWETMLATHGVDSHSASFAWTFRQQVFPALRFTDANPNLLSVSLPESGRWTKSAEPPLLP